MKALLAGAAMAAFVALPALAADIPLKAPVKAPPLAAPMNWTGFYVGASIGGEWVRDTGTLTLPPGPPQLFAPFVASGQLPSVYPVRADGVIGTFQLGYNWQIDRWLVGLETDISGPKVGTTTTVATAFPPPAAGIAGTYSTNVDYVGTVRARFGVLATPSVLLYGTGGFAYAGVEHSYSEANIILGTTIVQTLANVRQTETGWTAGGGIEWMVFDHVTVRGEYLYVRLSSRSFTTPSIDANCGAPGACSFTLTDDIKLQMARFGVNYKF